MTTDSETTARELYNDYLQTRFKIQDSELQSYPLDTRDFLQFVESESKKSPDKLDKPVGDSILFIAYYYTRQYNANIFLEIKAMKNNLVIL